MTAKMLCEAGQQLKLPYASSFWPQGAFNVLARVDERRIKGKESTQRDVAGYCVVPLHTLMK